MSCNRCDLNKLFDKSLDLQCVASLEGEFLYLNAAWETTTGFSKEELMSKPFLEFVHPDDREATIAEMSKLQNLGQEVHNFVNRYLAKDGSSVYLQWNSSSCKETKQIYATARDISRLYEFEGKLKDISGRFQAFADTVPVAIWELDTEANCTFVNQAWLNYTGREFTQELKRGWFEAIHPDDFRKTKNIFKEAFAARACFVLEYRAKNFRGDYRWMLDKGSPRFDEAGNFVGYVGSCVDIHDLKISTKVLAENQERINLLHDSAAMGIWDWDLISNKVDWDDNACIAFGIEPGTFGGDYNAFADLIHEDSLQYVQNAWKDTIENDAAYDIEFRVNSKNDELKFVAARGTLYRDENGSPIRCLGTCWDVTQQKLSEIMVSEANTYKDSLLNSTNYGIISADKDGVIVTFNKAAEEMLAYSADELIGKHTPAIWHDTAEVVAYAKELSKELGQTIAPGFDVFVAKSRMTGEPDRRRWTYIRKDQSRFPVDLTVTTLLNESGEIVGYLGLALDISEFVTRENILELYTQNTPAAVAMLDKDMRYLAWSKRWLQDYGLNDIDLLGRSHYHVFSTIEEEYPHWVEAHKRCLQGEVIEVTEDKFISAGGREDFLRYELHPWRDAAGEIGGIIMFTELITEEVRAKNDLEQKATELERSNKDLEQFAYVASHDLQEPLRMISSYADLFAHKFNALGYEDEKLKKYLYYIDDGAKRMRELISDVLVYSRVGRSYEKQKIDLNQVLDKVLMSFKHEIESEKISINKEALPIIMGYRVELQQLFQNLISNAVKFARKGFKAEIDIKVSDFNEDYYQIAIHDNGVGIEEKYFEKIFQVFQRLSNRKDIQGTGIGLAICKKVVDHHGGDIWLESEPNKGTSFYFSLPKIKQRQHKENISFQI